MSPQDNKRRLQAIWVGLERGDGGPMLAALDDDVRWTILGSGAWSGTWAGRDAVRTRLFEPLYAQFADRYTNRARRFIADGDHVAVECEGRVTTVGGMPYDNTYCFIFRLTGGRIREVREYCDTELISRALAPPVGPV